MEKEPARIIGAITGAATAIIALLVAFGLDLTQEQQAAILGVVAVVAPVVAGVVIRQHVYPPATVDRIEARAVEQGYVEGRTDASMDGVA